VAQGGLWVLGPDVQLFLEFGFEFGDYGMGVMFWDGQMEIFGLGGGRGFEWIHCGYFFRC
jgi:hypothetical protein